MSARSCDLKLKCAWAYVSCQYLNLTGIEKLRFQVHVGGRSKAGRSTLNIFLLTRIRMSANTCWLCATKGLIRRTMSLVFPRTHKTMGFDGHGALGEECHLPASQGGRPPAPIAQLWKVEHLCDKPSIAAGRYTAPHALMHRRMSSQDRRYNSTMRDEASRD
jgi:hypothetical protein